MIDTEIEITQPDEKKTKRMAACSACYHARSAADSFAGAYWCDDVGTRDYLVRQGRAELMKALAELDNMKPD